MSHQDLVDNLGIREGFCLITFIVLLMLVSNDSQGNESSISVAQNSHAIAVLYPQVREPYNQIFQKITEGIDQQYQGNTRHYILSRKHRTEDLQQWLQANKIGAVVALGSRSLKALPTLPSHLPRVLGAVQLNHGEDQLSGVYLSPSPLQLFKRLRQLRPSIHTVHVVDLSNRNRWLMHTAHQQAAVLGLVLNQLSAKDLTDVARHYQQLLNNIDPVTEAIWLARGGNKLDRALLNQILEAAWKDNLVVFSSNFGDVKRGVLFSLYPDNHAMGMRLAQLLQQLQKDPQSPLGMAPAENLLIAVNLRTADHLGLHFSPSELRDFHFVYPPP